MELSDSNVRYYALNPSQAGKIQYLLVEINPGQRTDLELVTHPGEECGFVMQGELTIILGSREIHLNEGDSIKFSSITPHRYVNRGDEKSVSIWAMV
jgi:quercetin dioxygenase-like cupin family protein